MNWQSFFLVNGRIRPIWRAFISFFVVIPLLPFVVNILLGVILPVLGIKPGTVALFALTSALALMFLLGLYKIFTAVLEGRPLGSVGLAFCGRWQIELTMGLALGGVMILSVASLERLFGLAHFSLSSLPASQTLRAGVAMIILLLIAATTEELAFRGYPFQRLVEAVGPVPAVAVFSILFGMMHLANPSATPISTFNTILVGVPLAVAYLRTRALWLPIGLHFSWNLMQGYVLGLPISGMDFPSSLLKAEVAGPLWLTGGAYGPEGSVIATGVIILATGYLLFSKSIYTTKEMRDLVFGPAPAQCGCPEVATGLADSNHSAPTGSPRAH